MRLILNFAAVVNDRRLQDSEPVFRTTDAVVWVEMCRRDRSLSL